MCYVSEAKHHKIESTLNLLLDEARQLRKEVSKKMPNIMNELMYIIRDILLLLEDLSIWDPNEEVCYQEFDSKIRQLRARLDWIKKKIGYFT